MTPRRAADPRTRVADDLRRSIGGLSTAAIARMAEDLPWFRELSAEDRSWVGMILQAGVRGFVDWFEEGGDSGGPAVATSVFGAAPRALAGVITLQQTVDLVRLSIEVVESNVEGIVAEEDAADVHRAISRYAREVAFATAEVYARAAEVRGAWDARLEALVVDAVVRAEADDSMQSRATALGWGSVASVTVVAGSTPTGSTAAAVDALRRSVARLGATALAAVQRRRLVVVLGGTTEALKVVTAIADHFGDGPIVLGPTVPHLFAAGRSARAALSGLAAAPAWPSAPRPVLSDELLPERVLAGDPSASRVLVDRIHHPLESHPALLTTATTYLETGGSLEATARALFVHPNTVRYRLGRIAEVTGYDLAHPREAHTVAIALAVGRLADTPPVEWRSGAPTRTRRLPAEAE